MKLKEILRSYSYADRWQLIADQENAKQSEKARKHLPRAFVDQYMEQHGFHDWRVCEARLLFRPVKNGAMADFCLQLENHELQSVQLVFTGARDIKTHGKHVPKRVTWDTNREVLLLSFHRQKGKNKAAVLLSDGSSVILTFDSVCVQ